MLDNLKADTRRMRELKSKPFPWYVIESLLFENGYQALVFYRVAHWFKRRRIPFFGPLCHRLALFLTGIDIAPGAEIGPGLLIAHGTGIVIGNGVRVGSGVLLLHGVTLGGSTVESRDRMPTLGDGVFVGAGACVLGGIEVGDQAFIGANSVVTEDVPAGAKVLVERPRVLYSPQAVAGQRDEDTAVFEVEAEG